jgi:hypothetical protein
MQLVKQFTSPIFFMNLILVFKSSIAFKHQFSTIQKNNLNKYKGF